MAFATCRLVDLWLWPFCLWPFCIILNCLIPRWCLASQLLSCGSSCMFVRQQVWNLLGMLNPGMSCFLLAFVSWVWIGTVKFVERHRPAWFRQPPLAGGRRDMFFFCFCTNWRSVQRKPFCLPMRCKMLHETQSLERLKAFKWALLETPHELDREQRWCLPLPVWRRRLYAAGLNKFWAEMFSWPWQIGSNKGYMFGAESLKSHDA